MILQCSHIEKSFLAEAILSDVSFHINEGEKAAIVGVNGSGKTTLLKIIVGEYPADSGEVILSKDTTVGYLAQNQEYDSKRTILEEMRDAKPEIIALEEEIASLSGQINHADGELLSRLVEKLDRANERFRELNGYAYESELVGVLKGLGFMEEEFDKPVHTLSGGEKTRVALAKMLLVAPDLIILDEPTNHLDMNAIHWLETYLSGYSGSVLLVAHDRYFLDRIVGKVIELRQAKAMVYQGNYSEYQKKRSQLLEAERKHYLNQQAEIKHQEAVIAKLKQFNREKSIKRAESRQKQLDKIERLDKPTEEKTEMNLRFHPKYQSGNDVLSVEHLTKGFDGQVLFKDISFEVKRGERVAVIGDNGTGKTTLLKIINELLKADEGFFTLGANVGIGYYDQEHHVLHKEKTLFEEIQDTYPDMTNTEIRNTLAAFLFTEDDVFKKIENLSGGERGRVSLAKLMLSDANFLILDEPTNHLDMDSKMVLEEALVHFEGTVLYVSHDRYFINQTATRILDLTHHRLLNYIGNFDYYLEKKEDMEKASLGADFNASGKMVSPAAEKSPADGHVRNQSETANLSGKASWEEQKKEQARVRKVSNALRKTEEEIERLESENERIDGELLKPEVATNSVKLQELSKKREENEKRLEKLMEEWEELSIQIQGDVLTS